MSITQQYDLDAQEFASPAIADPGIFADLDGNGAVDADDEEIVADHSGG